MKFKRKSDVMAYPDYVREDGKIVIRPEMEQHRMRDLFHVYDECGTEIDVLPRLKQAKEKYAE